MTARAALMREADMRRCAKTARETGVPLCVELPDGTKLHFGNAAKAPPSNPLDELFS